MSAVEAVRATDAIRLDGVVKRYGQGDAVMTALDGVDLAIEPGSFVSVIGPSGCGKSTLLRAVAGLEPVDGGAVLVHGAEPVEACAAKMVGLVPQNPALLPWLTVEQNVRLPLRLNRRGPARREALIGPVAARAASDVGHLLDAVGLADARRKLPAELSGGMQQRVAIVRALALQPAVLLMDEPFSALDEFTREALQEQLLDLWDEIKTTVVFVTHSVTEAVRLSDTVVVMAPKPGRIVDVLDIDLPRPRPGQQLKTPEFHHHEDLIRERLQNAFRGFPVRGAGAADER